MDRLLDKFFSALRKNAFFSIYVGGWFLYFFIFWSRAYLFDNSQNLLTRHWGLWGDWAVHFTMGSAMAFRDLFPSDSPLLLGAPLYYPFFANFVSALLVRVGVPFIPAFTVPSFFYSMFFIVCVYLFYRLLFKSEWVALSSSLIFLFNGGWGFFYYIKDAITSDSPFVTLLLPPKTYTNIEDLHIKWTNMIDTMLIPQRAFQLGFPISLIVLMAVYAFLEKNPPDNFRGGLWWKEKSARILIGAGLLHGLSPIIHTHSFVAVTLIISSWLIADLFHYPKEFVRQRLRAWLVFGGSALIVAGPLLYFFPLFSGGHAKGIQWFPGWFAHTWKINIVAMWWKNWGLTLPAAILGFAWKIYECKTEEERIHWSFVTLPFAFLFILSNLVLFHPWIWDNTKFLIWSSLYFCGLAGYFLGRFAGGPRA